MNREALKDYLAELPLYQYACIPTSDLVFSERVRHICRQECPMYAKSYACPPAVGSVEECRERCLAFPEVLVLVTVEEVEDPADMARTLPTRAAHRRLVAAVAERMRKDVQDLSVLSVEACALCPRCAYPQGPCRHPKQMFPCVESHGILATALAERLDMDFYAIPNAVTWYSLVFFRE